MSVHSFPAAGGQASSNSVFGSAKNSNAVLANQQNSLKQFVPQQQHADPVMERDEIPKVRFAIDDNAEDGHDEEDDGEAPPPDLSKQITGTF